jgi:UDP-glucose 4-epimerase
VQIGPRRLGDPPALVANADKAGQLLNWQPRYSDLERIVRDALAWEQQRQRIPSFSRSSAVGMQ